MDWDSWTLTQPSLWSSVLSSTWWSVERELSWSHQSPLLTVQDSMEPLLTLLTVECSGSVRMARLTDTIVLQAWPMTRWPGAASGLTRCQSVPHLLWLWMRRDPFAATFVVLVWRICFHYVFPRRISTFSDIFQTNFSAVKTGLSTTPSITFKAHSGGIGLVFGQ